MRHFTSTITLTLIALRRDRLQLPVWVLALSALVAFFTATYDSLLATERELFVAAEFYAGNPATRIFGLSSGASLGEYTMVRAYTLLSALAALMSVLAVVRHTRQNEETRQAEMIGSMVSGRYAGLAAALIVAVLANAVLAVFMGLGLILNGLPVMSSFAAGAAIAAVGLSFAGIAALTSQVASTSRGASGMAAAGIGIAFLLAAVGSVLGTLEGEGVRVAPAWPTWLSPMGWGQLIRPYGDDNWWLLGVFAIVFLALASLAVALTNRRDVGMGLLPESRGPANAAPSLLSPVGLVWRLQRGVFLGWAAAVIAFGLVMGALGEDIEEMMGELEASEIFARIGGTEELVDAYFVAIIGLLGSIISAYTVQVLLRMRIEEADGPLESILGAAVSRPRWMLSYAVIAIAGTGALMLLMGLSTGLAAGFAFNDQAKWLPSLTAAALAQTPGALVLAGVTIVAFAFLPRRAAGLAWGFFALALFTGPMLGEMLELPQALLNLSPFSHTPRLPAGTFDVVPVAVLLALSTALAAAGLAYFRRRDLAL
jgi:ABC-2 type transport system permease protein